MFKISFLYYLLKFMFNNVTILKKSNINIINLSSQL